jgi:hypothetical protein
MTMNSVSPPGGKLPTAMTLSDQLLPITPERLDELARQQASLDRKKRDRDAMRIERQDTGLRV